MSSKNLILSLLSFSALAMTSGEISSRKAAQPKVCVLTMAKGEELNANDGDVLRRLWLQSVKLRCKETGVDPDRLLNELIAYRFAWAPNGVATQFLKYSLEQQQIPSVTLLFAASQQDLHSRLARARQALQIGPLEVPATLTPEAFLSDLQGRRVLIEVLVRGADRANMTERVPLELEPLLESGNVYLLLRNITPQDSHH